MDLQASSKAQFLPNKTIHSLNEVKKRFISSVEDLLEMEGIKSSIRKLEKVSHRPISLMSKNTFVKGNICFIILNRKQSIFM